MIFRVVGFEAGVEDAIGTLSVVASGVSFSDMRENLSGQ
jgi:hypothetical protein